MGGRVVIGNTTFFPKGVGRYVCFDFGGGIGIKLLSMTNVGASRKWNDDHDTGMEVKAGGGQQHV